VLKVEGDNISAMEMGITVANLIESLETRKQNKFLSIAVQNEIENLNENHVVVTKDAILMTASAFYGKSFLWLYLCFIANIESKC
jgi:hypothetical protein